MSNKTCEECKSFPGMGYYCPIIGRFCDPNNETACEFFEKPVGRVATNGDVIRQGGDRALAEISVYEDQLAAGIKVYRSTLIKEKYWLSGACAISYVEHALNAPAENEEREE